MSIYNENDPKLNRSLSIANQMMIAARTAPKGKGRDTLEMLIVDNDDIKALSEQLHIMGDKTQTTFYHRDADNILHAESILLIGTKIEPLGLNEICQLCGFENCQEKEKYPNTPCVFNTGDLNLAIGSAVSLAADMRIDNRIMFSFGRTALEMGLLPESTMVAYAIPLSVSSKSPFFDR